MRRTCKKVWPFVGVDIQNVYEVDPDLMHAIFVHHVLRRDRLPAWKKQLTAYKYR